MIIDAQVQYIHANLDRGGWETHLQLLSDTDGLDVHQQITLEWQGMFGGDPGGWRTGFRGYVLPIQFSFDRVGSMAQFTAQTSDGFLRKGWLQSVGFADTDADPRDHYHQFDSVTRVAPGWAGVWTAITFEWAENVVWPTVPNGFYYCNMQDGTTAAGEPAWPTTPGEDIIDGTCWWVCMGGVPERMTMGRIVRHLLGYYDVLGTPPATNPDWVAHTNLVYDAAQNPHGWMNADGIVTEPFDAATNPGGTMRVDRYNIQETNNLWTTIQGIAKNEFFVAYLDKNDHFHYCRHPMYQAALPNPVMTFDQDFVIGRPVVRARHSDQIRQVKLHAVTDAGSTLHATYPASPVHVYGRVEDRTYIRCNNQDTLDEWARILYLYMNRDYTVTWTSPGLCGLLFELLDRVQVTYTGTVHNGVHIDWTNKKFWIHDIRVVPRAGFVGTSTFILEAESV